MVLHDAMMGRILCWRGSQMVEPNPVPVEHQVLVLRGRRRDLKESKEEFLTYLLYTTQLLYSQMLMLVVGKSKWFYVAGVLLPR